MRSSTFLKFSGALFVVMILALGLSQGATLAGPLIQATTAATSAAVSFPPCPPAGGVATGAAGASTSDATSGATEAAISATGNATVEAGGAATVNPPGYIGISVITVDSCGVRILEILPDTPAASAGLKQEDVIVAVNGTAFTGVGQLRQIMNNYHANDTLQLTVQRAGENVVVSVTLAVPPANFPPTVAAQPPAGAAATSPAEGTSAATPAATSQ